MISLRTNQNLDFVKKKLEDFMKPGKIVSILILCICFFLCLKQNTISYAKESTYLEENTWYDLSLIGGTTDEYTFEMPAKKYFYYEVVPDYYTENGQISSDSSTWFLPTQMELNYKVYEDHSCANYNGIWSSNKYSFSEGSKVKIKFISTSTDDFIWHFKLRVVTKEKKNFETENNNRKSKASKVKVGKTYSGLLMDYDEDWFVFTVPKTGKYKIYGVNTDTLSTYTVLNARVCNGRGNLLKSDNLDSGDGWITIYSDTLKKGKKVYIHIPYSGFKESVFYKIKIKSIK